jgi:hypothetical protein
MKEVADRLKIPVPTVRAAVKEGERISKEEGLVLTEVLNIKL